MKRMENTPVIGIDLGTTYSVVGVWKNGRVEILRNEQSKRITPSCVAFDEHRPYIGDSAKYLEQVNVRNTIINAKRLLGKSYAETANIRRAYDVSTDNNIEITVKGRTTVSPQEVCALILLKMKEMAQEHLGMEVNEAVISVPAHYTEVQRMATLDAADIAGLHASLIVDTTAAALAFGQGKTGKRQVLIYDLGGGSLDVSVIAVNDQHYVVLDSRGDSSIGGDDFTNCLTDHLAEKFFKEKGKDITDNIRAMTRLKCAAEKAKETLSISKMARIDIDALAKNTDFITTVTRAEFEEACSRITYKLLKPVQDMLKYLKMSRNQIDDIVLVGGSSRIPMVQSKLQDYFRDQKLNLSLNQDEAVAYGAALQSAQLKGFASIRLNEKIGKNNNLPLSRSAAPRLRSMRKKIRKFQEDVKKDEERLAIRNNLENRVFKLKQELRKKEPKGDSENEMAKFLESVVDWVDENPSASAETYRGIIKEVQANYRVYENKTSAKSAGPAKNTYRADPEVYVPQSSKRRSSKRKSASSRNGEARNRAVSTNVTRPQDLNCCAIS